MTPIACLTRQDGTLVATEPRLMPCETCPDSGDCEGACNFGDPWDMRLECVEESA